MPILLVVAATALAVWLVPEDRPEQPEAQASAPVPDQPRTVQGSVPRSATPPAATPATVPEPSRPGDEARALIAGLRGSDGAARAAFEEAQRQRQAGHAEDAYLLYFFAARQGHAAAALALGDAADPARFSADNGLLEQADAAQAYRWYRAAADAGSPEAGARLAALRERLQSAAAAGDAAADRLLLQWR